MPDIVLSLCYYLYSAQRFLHIAYFTHEEIQAFRGDMTCSELPSQKNVRELEMD